MNMQTIGSRRISGSSRGVVAGVLLAAAVGTAAQADLVVDQDLGALTGASRLFLEGSYLGKPSNASEYYTPDGRWWSDGRTYGEYVYQFTIPFRARVDIRWLSSGFVTGFRDAMILDSLTVDARGRNSSVRFGMHGRTDFRTGPVGVDAGTYYVVFDQSPQLPGLPPDPNPDPTFRAGLSVDPIQLSATISGATSMQNIWPRPYNGSQSNEEDPGFAAAYATPFAFYVSAEGIYSLANIVAGFNFSGMFYVDAPGVGQTITTTNLIGENQAYLVPGRQYYLVVSTRENVIPVGEGEYVMPAIDTPGPFSAQFEGPGIVTLGLIPAPAACVPLAMMGLAMRRRR